MENNVKCDKCGNSVPASKIKIDLKHKEYVCPDCWAGIAPKPQPKPQAPVVDNRATKQCTFCMYKYKFDYDRNYPPKCPYCNH